MRVLLVVAGLLSLVGAGSSGSGVQRLYQSPSGPITGFAQDGSLLAWFAPGDGVCNAVHLLSLGGIKVTLPKPKTTNVTCRWDVHGTTVGLAVAAGTDAALWTLHQRAAVDLDYVVAADARQPQERRFEQLAHAPAGAGLWLGGIAGSNTTLVYSETSVAYVNQVDCLSGGTCKRRISGGGVHRVVGRRNPLVPGTGPALGIAAAGQRIAYIRAGAIAADGRPVATPGGAVDVRNAASGALVSRVKPRGTPVAIALSTNVLALLERSRGTTHIAWYDAARGTRLGSIRVPNTTSDELSANDQIVVYRVGRVLHAVDLGSISTHKLVQTDTVPVGFSLAGSRLAWAENVNGRGRINAFFLGGRG